MTPARTAIKRSGPSLPAREIQRLTGLLVSDLRKLDYGCGHGADADHFGMEKYDPAWHPEAPLGLFDLVLCTYVLNVVPVDAEADILANIRAYLTPNGQAFISVRRDGPLKGIQRLVYLDLPILVENKKFCTYTVS